MKDGDARRQAELAVFSFLETGLGDLELPVPEGGLDRLAQLVFLVDRWSGKINLTGYRSPLEVAGGLVLDAAALLAALPETLALEKLADLGSGAGFPGLPIAILCPHLDVWLVDSRSKRHHFQREARRRIELPNVHPILGRSEQVSPELCDIVVAQAMAQPELALARMSEWARPGGLLVLPASETATEPSPPPDLAPLERRQYVVPKTQRSRQVWVSRKMSA